ncbi:hypothetical protein CYMTET_31264 [Cymbomonas tetramitiformis]|uniref:Major facilitator superfamily (MFS) profile domain-containing protein n=1 Tax=Cymbomonas tetramitiformis TaxID=36881 RepID=A0AAE0FHT3_9CHLO|nr:hypothetical protein CYMTET_31264 [Cymbomonas tetramitiformis]
MESCELPQQVMRKVRRRLLPHLFLMAFMCYLDRSNVAFAALEMNAALKISDAEYGTGASSFFLGYALCGVPSSLLVIRVGIARGLALVLIIWGATSALFALCDSAFAFLALRFVLGIAESGFFPSLLAYLTLWFTEGEIGHAYTLGACSATAVAGILGGPFAAAAMYLLDNCLGLPGWRWLFLVEGGLTVLLGLLSLFSLPSSPAAAQFLTASERDWLHSRQATENVKRATTGAPSLRAALCNRTIASLAVLYALWNTGYYAFIFFLPLVLQSSPSAAALGTLGVALLSTLPYICATFAMIWVARHSDRTGERRMHIFGACWVGGGALLGCATVQAFLSSTGGFAPRLALLSLAAAGLWSLYGPFWSYPTTVLDATQAAAGFASINSLGNLGGLCGPYLLGAIKQHTGSFAAGMAVLAVLQLLAGLLALAMPGKAPPASYSQLTEMTMVSADGVSETTNYSARCSEMQDNSTCSDPQI